MPQTRINLEGTGRAIEVHIQRPKGQTDVAYSLIVPDGSEYSMADLLDDGESAIAEYPFTLSQPAGAAVIVRKPAPPGMTPGQLWVPGMQWPAGEDQDPDVGDPTATYVLPWDSFWSVLGPFPSVKLAGPGDLLSPQRFRSIISPQIDLFPFEVDTVVARTRRNLRDLPSQVVRGFHEALARYSAELAAALLRPVNDGESEQSTFSGELLATIARGPLVFREAVTLGQLRPASQPQLASASALSRIASELGGEGEIQATLFDPNPTFSEARAVFDAANNEAWTSALYIPGPVNPFTPPILPGFDDDRRRFSGSVYLNTPDGMEQVILVTRQRDYSTAGRDLDEAIGRITRTEPDVVEARVGRIEDADSAEVWSSLVVYRERLPR